MLILAEDYYDNESGGHDVLYYNTTHNVTKGVNWWVCISKVSVLVFAWIYGILQLLSDEEIQ